MKTITQDSCKNYPVQSTETVKREKGYSIEKIKKLIFINSENKTQNKIQNISFAEFLNKFNKFATDILKAKAEKRIDEKSKTSLNLKLSKKSNMYSTIGTRLNNLFLNCRFNRYLFYNIKKIHVATVGGISIV